MTCKLPPTPADKIEVGDAESFVREGREILCDNAKVHFATTATKSMMLHIFDCLKLNPEKEDQMKYYYLRKQHQRLLEKLEQIIAQDKTAFKKTLHDLGGLTPDEIIASLSFLLRDDMVNHTKTKDQLSV